MQYFDAIALIVKALWAIWIRSLASFTLLFHIFNALRPSSPELDKVVGGKTDKATIWMENMADAFRGQPTESDKISTATADSLKKRVVELEVSLKAAREATKKPNSTNRSVTPRHASSASHVQRTKSAKDPSPTPSIAKTPHKQGIEEGQRWKDYIDASGLSHFERTGVLNVEKPVVEGVITSTASVAIYQKLVLRVQFTLKKGRVIEEEEVVAGLLAPSGHLNFKSKLKVPAHTQSISCVLVSADYLLAP